MGHAMCRPPPEARRGANERQRQGADGGGKWHWWHRPRANFVCVCVLANKHNRRGEEEADEKRTNTGQGDGCQSRHVSSWKRKESKHNEEWGKSIMQQTQNVLVAPRGPKICQKCIKNGENGAKIWENGLKFDRKEKNRKIRKNELKRVFGMGRKSLKIWSKSSKFIKNANRWKYWEKVEYGPKKLAKNIYLRCTKIEL